MSVMGSGAVRKLGMPVRRWPAAVVVSPDAVAVPAALAVPFEACGAQEANAPAPTTPAAARPPNLNRSRLLIPLVCVLMMPS